MVCSMDCIKLFMLIWCVCLPYINDASPIKDSDQDDGETSELPSEFDTPPVYLSSPHPVDDMKTSTPQLSVGLGDGDYKGGVSDGNAGIPRNVPMRSGSNEQPQAGDTTGSLAQIDNIGINSEPDTKNKGMDNGPDQGSAGNTMARPKLGTSSKTAENAKGDTGEEFVNSNPPSPQSEGKDEQPLAVPDQENHLSNSAVDSESPLPTDSLVSVKNLFTTTSVSEPQSGLINQNPPQADVASSKSSTPVSMTQMTSSKTSTRESFSTLFTSKNPEEIEDAVIGVHPDKPGESDKIMPKDTNGSVISGDVSLQGKKSSAEIATDDDNLAPSPSVISSKLPPSSNLGVKSTESSPPINVVGSAITDKPQTRLSTTDLPVPTEKLSETESTLTTHLTKSSTTSTMEKTNDEDITASSTLPIPLGISPTTNETTNVHEIALQKYPVPLTVKSALLNSASTEAKPDKPHENSSTTSALPPTTKVAVDSTPPSTATSTTSTTTSSEPATLPSSTTTTTTSNPTPVTSTTTTTSPKPATVSSPTTTTKTSQKPATILSSTTTSLKLTASPAEVPPSDKSDTSDDDDAEHTRKRPTVNVGAGREGGSSIDENIPEVVPTSSVSLSQTSLSNNSSNNEDFIARMKNGLRDVKPFYIALTLLITITLMLISCCCCCKVCSKKRRGVRHRRLKEYGKEKEFLLRDRGKGNKYHNDSVTLLEGSSEDEF